MLQRSTVLGNKIEMEITSLVEQNPTLLRLGLHLEYNDARHRIAMHLQRNIDRNNCSLNTWVVPSRELPSTWVATATMTTHTPRIHPTAIQMCQTTLSSTILWN
uniref:Uncharacterized protein n=1 Tax=Timema tahoe TaxID=61484 RepID=A0A7R9IQL0_9NEOP|nr:unnamed protein product [Timema tahoe]